jgi:hypothetical protein
LIASLAKLAVSNGSLRSLRCSLEAAVFVESDETTVSGSQLWFLHASSPSPADPAARTSRARIARLKADQDSGARDQA